MYYVDVNSKSSKVLNLGLGFFFSSDTQPVTDTIHAMEILPFKRIFIWDYLDRQIIQDVYGKFAKSLRSLELLADHYKQEGEFCYQLFRDSVRCVKCTNDALVIVQDKKILQHNLLTKKIVWRETFDNFFGACSVACETNSIVAYPNTVEGTLSIENMDKSTITDINAHTSRIGCMALNHDGSLVATTSIKGTLIRVFNTSTGERIKELRRGTTMATIHSIAFNQDSTQLCCTSDTGTLHLWNITKEAHNRTSYLNMINYVGVEYVNSEWSEMSYRGLNSPSFCVFVDKSIRVISKDGTCTTFNIEKELVKEDASEILLKPIDLDGDAGWSLI
jgi:WD40 repeat protein